MHGKTVLFHELSSALNREEAQHARLSDITRISLSTLYDLTTNSDEWYAVVPLGNLRCLCALLSVDFDGIFSVPAYDKAFEAEWKEKLESNIEELSDKLYMDDVFWQFLRGSIDVLNLYPLQWTDDITKAMKFELSAALCLLGVKG
jgi:hypothetical protein